MHHSTETFFSPKRLLGRDYRTPAIQPYLGQLGVKTRSGPGGRIIGEVHNEPVSIPQVMAEVLRHLASVGEKETGVLVRRVVIAVPVAFEEAQRAALKRAARLAGLTVVALLDEPFAATLAYGAWNRDDQLVAVFDFGGGTFDFTLAKIEGGRFLVQGEAGDPWLGGDDFDIALAEQMAASFQAQRGVDLRRRAVEWQHLLMLCERAKRKLSLEPKAEIVAKNVINSLGGPVNIETTLDRAAFEKICGGLVDRAIELVDSCMALSGTEIAEVDEVVMTGGVSRMPLVRSRLQDFFKRDLRLTVNPEHAIVVGNALYGQMLAAAARRHR